jgi:GrpB-like predicted nucleotidyltransferase (UPF0157 family)
MAGGVRAVAVVRVWPVVSDIALAIEHVGSTSLPGLAAKPIVDLDVVVPGEAEVPVAIERLATLGYVHRGNLGIEGREAFHNPPALAVHNMYVCIAGSAALQNHLALRDYLRAHPEVARRYGELKKRLASEFPHDIDSYIDGKTELILEVLRTVGFSPTSFRTVGRANRKAV